MNVLLGCFEPRSNVRLDTHAVNNAGIMHPDDSDAIGTSEKIFDLTYNINVKGNTFCSV